MIAERGMEDFARGRKLEKIGLKAQDTAEIFFKNVAIPSANVLGKEGEGFAYLKRQLATERLSVALQAVAACETTLEWTLVYCKERRLWATYWPFPKHPFQAG